MDEHPYRLERLSASTWRLVDSSMPSGEPGSVVAAIEEIDESGVVVSWVHSIPLATRYMSAEMVLIDLDLWRRRRNAAEPPRPIPHMPPTGAHKTISEGDDAQ